MISYSSPQRDLADRLYKWLVEKGHAPKLDHLDIPPGDRFANTLAWWLSACHVAIVLVSEDALRSDWVRYELSVLVNRERDGHDVKIVLVLLGGLGIREVSSRPGFSPLDLGALQARALSNPNIVLSDEALDDLLEKAFDDMAAPAPIDALVGIARDNLERAGTNTLVRALESLRKSANEPPDPWRDGVASGDPHPLRSALARDLCQHDLSSAYAALDELAHEPGMHGRIEALLDANVMANFNASALQTVHEAWIQKPAALVVLGYTTELLALKLAQAVRIIHNIRTPFPTPVISPLTGDSPAAVADGIVEEFRRAVCEDGEDPEEYIADRVDNDHPVILVLERADGLNSEIADLVAQKLPGVAIVVLASKGAGPSFWRSKLPGAPVAGPHFEGETWKGFVNEEAALARQLASKARMLKQVMRTQ
jgi:hypothetical protein